jgi:hypothetical protein
MSSYRPKNTFDASLLLLTPTYTKVSGVVKKTFPELSNGLLFFGSFKTYGGTERDVNGIYSIEDTAIIETWFRPDITSGCRIALANGGAIYDILGDPENIELRNQFLKFKVKRVKGGA